MKIIKLRTIILVSAAILLSGSLLFSETHQQKQTITTFDLTDNLSKELKKNFSEVLAECSGKLTLSYQKYYSFKNNRLLLLLSVSDYLCSNSNTFIPIIIDIDGELTMGRPIYGAPDAVLIGPNQTLWLNSQWTIEGSYPTLLNSTDGINWKEISLPANRNVDCCFEFLSNICFTKNSIRLRFYGSSENITKAFAAKLKSNKNAGLNWKKLSSEPDNMSGECLSKTLDKGGWVLVSEKNLLKFTFQNKKQTVNVLIPGILQEIPVQKK